MKSRNVPNPVAMTPLQPDNILLLNEQQREAATSVEGYIRVVAGAGSGKTKTLVQRYVFLVNEVGINPANILCITFTNKAALEMKKRTAAVLQNSEQTSLICTYHGLAVHILREDANKLAYPKTFTIMDEEDQKSVLREIYEELNLKQKDLTFQTVLNEICSFKHNSNYISDFIDLYDEKDRLPFIEQYNKDLIGRLFIRYLQKQQKGFYLDFDDLLLFAIYILENHQDVATKWQQRLDYIMVDETQDNNPLQWRMLNILQRKHHNLFVVGDPDQCIYEWRGATPQLLLDFDQEYEPTKTIFLNQNYRSTPNILDVANSIIQHNEMRFKKDLFSTRQPECKVCHYHGKSEIQEAEYITKKIIRHQKHGGKLSDVAILYRASYLSRFIEQALLNKKLPYVVYGGIRFFERKEIKDALSYLRMVDIADDLSFKRVVNLPSRKLGKVFISNLTAVANVEKDTLYNTLKKHLNDPEFHKNGAVEFVDIIESVRKEMKNLSISDTMQQLLEKSSLNSLYRQDGDEERVENVKELIESMKMYEENNRNEENVSVTQYLQDIALYTNLDYKKSGDTIKIMTIHQAKGLEFPIVFVAGLSEGVFPSLRTMLERQVNGLEEERRLAYVAVTRAKDELYLTESEGFNHSIDQLKYPSRFIFEIDRSLLDNFGRWTKDYEEAAHSYIRYIDERYLKVLPEPDDDEEDESLQVGDEIEHKFFGLGTIIDIDEEQEVITVKFENIEEQKHLSISALRAVKK